MTSFLSTFSISASLTRHAIELLSSWRTSKDAFAHNLPLSHPDRLRPGHSRSTSLGISKTPHLPTSTRESCPESTEAPSSERRCQTTLSFRPQGFSPSRRLTPRDLSRAYCIPLPVWGSLRFVYLRELLAKVLDDTLPATPITPSKAFPFFAAAPCHQGPCLLAVCSRFHR